MGTSGARTGFKIFSINTTIRNPKRNYDFLSSFEKFDGKLMNDENLYKYLFELVKKGIYRFSEISQSVRVKLENNIDLTPLEVKQLIDDNPQATGLSGRVMTQLRSLKDQGFLSFVEGQNRKYNIYITDLGKLLLAHPENASTIYTKMLIGMHAKNPSRTNILNESRPFLNTLFVINEVNRIWKELGNTPKGILKHEFATFVLSMKDCNYKKCAAEIIKYRSLFKYEINNKYIQDYLKKEDILPLAINSILKDYPDEVFRKFEMTELIVQHGKFNYLYYDFSQYNLGKIQVILDKYKDYKFINFDDVKSYNDYLYKIEIPWEQSDLIKKKIIETKAKILGITLNENKTLEEQEVILDRIFYSNALSKAVERYDEKLILKELLILSGTNKNKSIFSDISESIRLEYLLALIIGKKYGTKGLVSNIIYSEDGLPLHCAGPGKCDIVFYDKEGSYIFEPTMLRGRDQQLNNETTNIVRHMKNEENSSNIKFRTMMVAPCIHPDVADYFKYKASSECVKIITLNIEKTADLFQNSLTIKNLNDNYDSIINYFLSVSSNDFVDTINNFKFNQKLI